MKLLEHLSRLNVEEKFASIRFWDAIKFSSMHLWDITERNIKSA